MKTALLATVAAMDTLELPSSDDEGGPSINTYNFYGPIYGDIIGYTKDFEC